MHLFTIGHSTRTFKELSALLKEQNIRVLVDVRRWASSEHCPQFNRERLKEGLEAEGIRYVWLGEELRGYRSKGLEEKSPNKAWRSQGFRNYADYTLTEEFKRGIEKMLGYAEEQRGAYMCAERFYWRCHRRVISDYLKAQGNQITHIIDEGEVREHKLPSCAGM